jgi:hypothetical protein
LLVVVAPEEQMGAIQQVVAVLVDLEPARLYLLQQEPNTQLP